MEQEEKNTVKRLLTVNQLPVRTWNWLRMNESEPISIENLQPQKAVIEYETATCGFADNIVSREEIITSSDTAAEAKKEDSFVNLRTGMGEEMEQMEKLTGAKPLQFRAAAGTKHPPVLLHLTPEDTASGFLPVELIAEEGAALTIFMDYTSQPDAKGLLAVRTKIRAEKNAVVHLVQLQLLGKDCTLLNDIGGTCGEGASIQVLQLFLGTGRSYAGCEICLEGKESVLEAELGYFGRDKQQLDINYVAVHKGENTKSTMKADGVLQDQASKLFRGTIDFQTGASGAEGIEKEDVLLLDEGVVNRTIPLILCGEENVQGNHGATIGKLDEELLFYLSSRGMSREAASRMVTRAKLLAICGKIGSEKEKRLAEEYLEEVMGNEV